ncbi:hypothetical protein NHL50_04100 [Acidimicrobiia bacterium EGI L10123]|nr:hypothetical protein [Acidimicrobiia bacterium EGI L10123]
MFEITALLWRRRYIVITVACGLIVLGVASVVIGRSTTYTAESRVLVDQPAIVGNTGGASVPAKLASLAPTFCLFLDGDEAQRAIADEAGVDAAQVSAIASCTPLEGTTALRVAATSGAAEESQAVAAAAASYLAEEISTRYAGDGVPAREHIEGEVLVSAERPAADPDDTARKVTLVVVFALLVAAAFAVAAEPHRADSRHTAPDAPAMNGRRERTTVGAP